jgi:hypothetical protein
MTKPDLSRDICRTCNSAATCILVGERDHPIFDCELLDRSSDQPEKTRSSAAGTEKAAVDTAMGLCCNCANNGSCTIANAPGGIWHCEEYV